MITLWRRAELSRAATSVAGAVMIERYVAVRSERESSSRLPASATGIEYTPAALADSTAATTRTSIRAARNDAPLASATLTDRRAMPAASRAARRTGDVPARDAATTWIAAIPNAPAAVAASS